MGSVACVIYRVIQISFFNFQPLPFLELCCEVCGEAYVLVKDAPCVWHRTYACRCYPNACLGWFVRCDCVACVRVREKYGVTLKYTY